jgi:membrane protein YqaA with SNARE-associated domain
MYKLVVIYLLALTGIIKAVPMGFVLQAPPIMIGVMTLLGGFTSVIFLFFFGYRFKKIILRGMGRRGLEKKRKRGTELLEKYGVAGLGLFGPILIGSSVTIILGILVSDERRRVLLWSLIGITLWTTVLSFTAAVGLEFAGRFNLFGN